MARCIRSEREGRWIFYGAMITEGLIALCCAAAMLAFYGNGGGIYDAVQMNGVSDTIYGMSLATLGIVRGAFTLIGIAICPISSGDTALRSIRMIIMDNLKIETTNKKPMIVITILITLAAFILLFIDFNILWRHFSRANQTMAMIVLWTASVYLLYNSKKTFYVLLTALPAMFMTAVTVTYIFTVSEGFGLDHGISVVIGLISMIAAGMTFVLLVLKKRNNEEPRCRFALLEDSNRCNIRISQYRA